MARPASRKAVSSLPAIANIDEQLDEVVMNNKCPLVVFSTWHPEHAQKVMQRLGIRYLHAVPQSIADCWQFYCCEDIPDDIPEDDKKFLSFVFDYKDPFRSIGYGLNKEMAEDIQGWIVNN